MKTKAPRQNPEPEMDPEQDPRELETAVDETIERKPAPELPMAARDLTEWDQPPGQAGVPAPKVSPDDEASTGQQLVEEGLEEADRDQRIAAADPDYEP
jgi:hypothetical protein